MDDPQAKLILAYLAIFFVMTILGIIVARLTERQEAKIELQS